MKSLTMSITASLLSLITLGCSAKEPPPDISTPITPQKILIAYYSRGGNTKSVAMNIQQTTGGAVFEIVPVSPYPENYQETTAQAKKEINASFKPVLKAKIDDISQYDVIFIGSPNWWSSIAPPVATFLTSYDFKGKTIVPFITHGGGGSGASIASMRKLVPNAMFVESLAIRDKQLDKAPEAVNTWLRKIIKK